MTPAQAVLWQVVRQHRFGLAADAAYLLVAASSIRLLPAAVLHYKFDEQSLVVHSLALPCSFVVLHVLAIFSSISEQKKDSGYPTNMFVLPVTARFLVVWPMIHGCLALAALWLVIATQILWPAGINAPLLLPLVLLWLALAGMQAIGWIPLAQSWLRVAIAVPVYMALIGGAIVVAVLIEGLQLQASAVPRAIVIGVLMAFIGVAYAVARHSVAMARRGDSFDWRAWQRLQGRLLAWRKPAEHPFASAGWAQLWFECRGQAWFLPAMLAPLLLIMGLMMGGIEKHKLELGYRFLAIGLAVPAFVAGFLGAPTARQDAWSKYALGPFLATRPLTSTALVKAKFQMCAVSALITWLLALVLLTPVYFRPGLAQSLYEAAQAAGIARAAAITLLLGGASLALTWLQLVVSLWLGLTGREWVVNTVTFSFLGVMFVGGLCGFWVYLHPEWQPRAMALLPWAMHTAVVAKLILAANVILALVQSRLITLPTAVGLVGLWCVIIAGLLGAAVWLAPPSLVSASSLLPSLVILVPFSRLAVCPLALEWNRHR